MYTPQDKRKVKAAIKTIKEIYNDNDIHFIIISKEVLKGDKDQVNFDIGGNPIQIAHAIYSAATDDHMINHIIKKATQILK
ncbi:MAG: hypothetical protein COA50_01200 [Flavobacteriaceae bacterium]|nr:MAG: hypothetical protein COA50_01200 [Flavobacteriaceae bacterium]